MRLLFQFVRKYFTSMRFVIDHDKTVKFLPFFLSSNQYFLQFLKCAPLLLSILTEWTILFLSRHLLNRLYYISQDLYCMDYIIFQMSLTESSDKHETPVMTDELSFITNGNTIKSRTHKMRAGWCANYTIIIFT